MSNPGNADLFHFLPVRAPRIHPQVMDDHANCGHDRGMIYIIPAVNQWNSMMRCILVNLVGKVNSFQKERWS
jgi:hypothetical protein